MNGDNALEPTNILLSREELLFVLDLLQADSIPGLDADPLGELTPEQRSLALIWAERALRARELAHLQEDGEVVLHNALLTAIGVCAYPQSTVFVYHWAADGDILTRYFGHMRGNNIVAHSRPEDVLHLFTLLPSKEHLVDQVLAVCEYEDVPAHQPFEFTVSSGDFARVRELAEAGEAEQAIDVLSNGGVAPEAAAAYVQTLADSPRVSIMQTLRQQENAAVEKQDFTLIQNGHQMWLVSAASGETGDAPLRVKTTVKDEIGALFEKWL